MRDQSKLIDAVNDAIQATKAAKDELYQRTVDLVAVMQAEGKTRREATQYMDKVCATVDGQTARWAWHFFTQCWPADSTDE